MMNLEIAWLADRSCGGITLHPSSDIWKAFLWHNWNRRCDPSVRSIWSSVASDLPLICLYINVPALDLETVGESARVPVVAHGVCCAVAA